MDVASGEILKEIIKALKGLNYGYIQIVVHNGKVVQIDRTEKTRFDVLSNEKGGGI